MTSDAQHQNFKTQMAMILTARTKLYFHVYYILVFDAKYIKITLTEDLSEEYLFFTKQEGM